MALLSYYGCSHHVHKYILVFRILETLPFTYFLMNRRLCPAKFRKGASQHFSRILDEGWQIRDLLHLASKVMGLRLHEVDIAPRFIVGLANYVNYRRTQRNAGWESQVRWTGQPVFLAPKQRPGDRKPQIETKNRSHTLWMPFSKFCNCDFLSKQWNNIKKP